MTFTHFAADGAARMVDVGGKPDTMRSALASGCIRMAPPTLEHIHRGAAAKGDVFGVARIAAIMAAKRTAELVPLCHPLALSGVEVELEPDDALPGVCCRVRVNTCAPTGVEMEALCAVQVALLTIYDMCKAHDRGMIIDAVHLLEKSGGCSGDWQCAESKAD